MLDLSAVVIAAAIAFKRELLQGFATGAFLALALLLFRPILRRRATPDEVRRLLFAMKDRVSTYVLTGLGAGSWFAAIGVLLPLCATTPRRDPAAAFLGCLLFMLGVMAMSRIARREVSHLARHVIALQASNTSQ